MDLDLINRLGLSRAGQQHLERVLDSPADFVDCIRVEFEDGSTMTLNHANCWVDERLTIIQTEHCGDYVIPHAGTLLIEKLPRSRTSPVELSTDLLAPGYRIWTEEELEELGAEE